MANKFSLLLLLQTTSFLESFALTRPSRQHHGHQRLPQPYHLQMVSVVVAEPARCAVLLRSLRCNQRHHVHPRFHHRRLHSSHQAIMGSRTSRRLLQGPHHSHPSRRRHSVRSQDFTPPLPPPLPSWNQSRPRLYLPYIYIYIRQLLLTHTGATTQYDLGRFLPSLLHRHLEPDAPHP